MEELYRKNIIDFIEGRADAYEFYEWIEATPDILDWLQSKVPDGATMQELAEEKIDYYLEELPKEKQRKIYEAHADLCAAIETGSEEKLAMAVRLVELMATLEEYGVISKNDTIYTILCAMKNTFAAAETCNPDYLEFAINVVKELFERTYIVRKNVPYTVRAMYKSMTSRVNGRLGACLNLQGYLFGFMKDFMHEESLVRDETLGEKHRFMLDVCPEYIDGVEVSEAQIIENLIAEVPEAMPKSKRKKLIKEKIKATFHVDGKYPRWVQGGDWPIAPSGKPMRFISQRRKKGKEYEGTLYTIYTFEDVDTGEIRTVEQFT